MDSRLDFESERVSPGFFGEVDLGSKPGLVVQCTLEIEIYVGCVWASKGKK